jgi:hypothetical protein
MNIPTAKQWHPVLAPLLKFSPDHLIISQQHPNSFNAGARRFSYLPYDEEDIIKIFKKDRNLYEVLPENLPRCFPVDIDIKPSHKNYGKYTYENIIQSMTSTIEKCVKDVAEGYMMDNNKIVVSVVKNQDRKQSLHIIYPIYFENQETQYQFAKFVHWNILQDDKSILKCDDELYFDTRIYSKNQNLRMIYQTKKEYPNYPFEPYDKNIKNPLRYLTGIYTNVEDITFMDTSKLESLVVTKVHAHLYKSKQACQKKVENEYKMIMRHFEEFSNLVYYEKHELPPIKVDISQESSLSFYIQCIPNSNEKPQSYHVWYTIGQTLKNLVADNKLDEQTALELWITWSNKAANIYKNEKEQCQQAWNNFIVRPPGKHKYSESILRVIATYYRKEAVDKYDRLNLAYNLFSKCDNDHFEVYNARYCKYDDLKDVDGILLHSNMGTGKTVYVKKVGKNVINKRIIVISPRKSFSINKVYELREIFSDFKDYTELTEQEKFNWLQCNRLAIQFESLHHLSHIKERTAYDLVILDEVESILNQVSSATNGSEAATNFRTLLDIINYSKKFIMADAFVMQRSIKFAKKIEEMFDKKVRYSMNAYKQEGRIAVVLGNAKSANHLVALQNRFMSHLIDSLSKGKKLCAIVASKSYKRALLMAIRQKLGESFMQNIRHYDADSGIQEIEELKMVSHVWGDPDVKLVLYTTKITVGIDFSIPDVFDLCYVFGMSTCPIARDLIQSHFRVRHLKDNKIYVALYSGCPYLIKSSLANESRKNAYINDKFENVEEEELFNSINNFNSLEEHVGKYAYSEIFIKLLEDTGYDIQYEEQAFESDIDIKKLHEDAFRDMYVQHYNDFKLIPLTKADDIRLKVMAGKAETIESLQLHAYNFYRFVIRRTQFYKTSEEDLEKLLKESNCEYNTIKAKAQSYGLSLKDHIETELFNLYYIRREIRIFIDNVLTESKCDNVEIELFVHQKSVKAVQKDVMKLESIKNMCLCLGLQNSIDITTKVEESNILAYYEHYKKLKDIEKQIHDANFGIGFLKAKDDTLKAKQLVNLMLKSWNGCTFGREVIANNRTTNGRKRTYEYFVEPHQESLLALFWKFL